MFKDTPEGQTHSFGDNCGEPAHNCYYCLDKSQICPVHGMPKTRISNGIMTTEQIKKEFQFILPAGLQDFEWEAIIKKVNKIRQEDLEEIEKIGEKMKKEVGEHGEDLNKIIITHQAIGYNEALSNFLSKIKELYK